MFVKASEVSGGSGFFTPKDYKDAVALLVEPKSIRRDVPNTYKGKTTNRDEVTADITVFDTEAELNAGKPSKVMEGVTVGHGSMVRALEKILGGAMCGVARLVDTKSGNTTWVFDDPAPGIEEKVEGYYTQREAALAAALADAPDDF